MCPSENSSNSWNNVWIFIFIMEVNFEIHVLFSLTTRSANNRIFLIFTPNDVGKWNWYVSNFMFVQQRKYDPSMVMFVNFKCQDIFFFWVITDALLEWYLQFAFDKGDVCTFILQTSQSVCIINDQTNTHSSS